MGMNVKELDDANYKKMLKLARMFNIEKIDLSYYKNILKFYDNEKLVGLVNYSITPSMKGKDKLFIRNLYYIDNIQINDIVLSLCNYCKNKNLIIMTTIDDNDFSKECITAFFNNNFKGKNIILYTYYTFFTENRDT